MLVTSLGDAPKSHLLDRYLHKDSAPTQLGQSTAFAEDGAEDCGDVRGVYQGEGAMLIEFENGRQVKSLTGDCFAEDLIFNLS